MCKRLDPCRRSSNEEDHLRDIVDQEEGIYKEEEVSKREVSEEDLIEQLH